MGSNSFGSQYKSIRPGDNLKQIKERFKINSNIRVRVIDSIKRVGISGKNMTRNLRFQKDVKKVLGPSLVKFNCQGQSKNKNNRPILFASLSSNLGNLDVNGETYKGKIHILAHQGKDNCDVVNELSMEDYISSLLSKEMNSKWPIEALKAQAVAARTYAVHKIHSKQVSKVAGHEAYYDLESSEKHQVSGSKKDITNKTKRAASETAGEVLVTSSKSKLTPIFFHASCGGKTNLPEIVWDNFVDGYQSVSCDRCRRSTKNSYGKKISQKRFKQFLNWIYKNNLDFKGEKVNLNDVDIAIAPDSQKYNSLKVYLDDNVMIISKPLLRRYFGRVLVRSNHFKLEMTKNEFIITGKGNGHGVGMCQVGALDYAQLGWNYKKILAHFFPEHEIAKVY